MTFAGRRYARVYEVSSRRGDLQAFLQAAAEAAGCRILFASPRTRAPSYLGVQGPGDERLGLLVYLFRMSRIATRNRPDDESKGQIRYGSESSWHTDDHQVGKDIAGVDTTLILGVHLEYGLFIGLDPRLYDPLPMGISFYAKDADLHDAKVQGWHVWERVNRAGSVRAAPRAQGGLETMVGFRPERLLDYVKFERKASDFGLDQPLRFSVAAAHRELTAYPDGNSLSNLGGGRPHDLERLFDISSQELLEIISTRNRLQVAVRGGVAEHHLEKQLRVDPAVQSVRRLDRDGQPDFDVQLVRGRRLLVECKNASPKLYKNGDYKVEVQKTRTSKSDPASRYYRTDQFDVLAACMYAPTGAWTFRYRRAAELAPHGDYPHRIMALQRITSDWARDVAGA
ncbi:hypothetical protein ABN034_12405 [Actinopolymorpha sp. B11F2]|uniref:hypothetical protein n=1 Tax=Actinopolymorpha sp. B11F2 TaxID=3160862 RepID=UPI0032E37136